MAAKLKKNFDISDLEQQEIDRLRQTIFSSDAWFGFRMIALGSIYANGPSAQVLQEVGLTSDELEVLSSLYYWGDMTANIIGELAGRPKNSISRAVIRLTTSGLIESEADTADRRRVVLRINEEGRRQYESAADIFRVRENKMFGCLSKSEKIALDTILRKLLLNWARHLSRATGKFLLD